jgi:catechol 2,3-dioxygenase-like lactoylglutathione lyase family enzyme
MKIRGLVWLGIKTDKFQGMEQFFQGVMGLQQIHHEHDFVVFQLPNKDTVEIFGPQGPNQHFAPDSIVCGFLIDDIRQARQELIEAGIELVGSLQEDRQSGLAWQHFRGPDGNLYELTYRPDIPLP